MLQINLICQKARYNRCLHLNFEFQLKK